MGEKPVTPPLVGYESAVSFGGMLLAFTTQFLIKVDGNDDDYSQCAACQ